MEFRFRSAAAALNGANFIHFGRGRRWRRRASLRICRRRSSVAAGFHRLCGYSRPLLHWPERRNLQPQTNHRSQVRCNVFLAASLIAGAVPLPVRVRNLSSRGALLDGVSLPPAGVRVRLLRGELSAEGQVAWATHGHAGIRFAGDIDVAAWVKRLGHPGQQRVDEAVAAMRRDQPLPEPDDHISASLGAISAELDAICERLAASPDMTVDLAEELVKLDALARALQQGVERSR